MELTINKVFINKMGVLIVIAKFKIELEDLIAVQRDAVNTSKFHKRNKLFFGIAAVVLVTIPFKVIGLDLILIILASTGLFFICYYVIYEQALLFQSKRLANNNPSLLGRDCTLTISEKEFLREFKNSSQNTEWKEVMLAREDAERYILYISDIQIIAIKKHPDNLSKEDVQQYNELIRNYLSQAGLAIKRV